MRRVPAVILPVLVALALTGCVPTPFDPRTGAGYDDLLAEFTAMSPEEQLAAIAAGDAGLERSLWAGGDLEEALGGPEAADEVFTGLFTQVEAAREAVDVDDETFVLASTQDDLAEAQGAGTFAGMLLGRLLADAGITATRDGTTGDAVHDFSGSRGDMARVTISAPEGGAISTTFELSTTYKGVKIEVKVGTQIDPCPDAAGVLTPEGTYQVNVTGPDGTGSSTRVDVATTIRLDDDAQIADFDHTYEATYSTRPQPPGSVFDFTTRYVRFGRDANGVHTYEENAAAFWDAEFEREAGKVGAFFSSWVADSIKAAAQQGWEDGRCIELAVTPSAGPNSLDPGQTVSVLAAPIAKQDAAPAGGTVVATLTGGEYAIGPEGEKVPADATFTYQAPREINESGTVHFESRSRRGVGTKDITFDTMAEHYAVSGGSGVFAGTGEWCAGAEAFSTIGGDVTTVFYLDSGDGGTIGYAGGNMTGGWNGAGTFTVDRRDGVPISLHVNYSGLKYNLDGSATPHAETMTFSITRKDSCDAG